MTQSDNKTTDNEVQTVSDKIDIEVAREEVGEEIGRVQEQAKNQISIPNRLEIAREYCDRFTYDELVELTGAGETTVHDQIRFWLATDKVVEVGQKKWDKSVYSTRAVDIAQNGEIDVDEFAEKLRSNKEDTVDTGGDSQNEGDS